MRAALRRGRSFTVTRRACVVLLLVAATAASAAPANAATVSPPDPVGGDTVTVSRVGRECPNNVAATYTGSFAIHNSDGTYTTVASGPATSGPQGVTYSAQLSQAGDYRASIDAYCPPPGNDHQIDSAPFTVGEGLGGSISVSPDPPTVNQAAALSAAATGGNPGYNFTWDLNNDGTFGDATTQTPTTPSRRQARTT